MLCKNLDSWAGENFHHKVGDVIDLDEATAVARCDAGLATAQDPEELKAARRRVEAAQRAPKKSAEAA